MPEEVFVQEPKLIVPVVAMIGTALVFIVWIVAAHWKRVRQLQIEASLKQDMINRGLSAGDVERVLWASSTPPPAPPTPESISDNEYALVEKMIDEGRSAEEIERLIRAFKGGSASLESIQEAIRRG
jgi:hypothetical protein